MLLWQDELNLGSVVPLAMFIGPKSDHWLPLSLTHSRLVHLIDVTLVCEDTKSKLVDVVTVSDVADVCCWS